MEFLGRCVIGVVSSSSPSNSILEGILAAGVNCLIIQLMGGMLHLITFDSLEDKIAMIDSKWLENWFIHLENVNDSSVSIWRETRIKVYGVPLSIWDT